MNNLSKRVQAELDEILGNNLPIVPSLPARIEVNPPPFQFGRFNIPFEEVNTFVKRATQLERELIPEIAAVQELDNALRQLNLPLATRLYYQTLHNPHWKMSFARSLYQRSLHNPTLELVMLEWAIALADQALHDAQYLSQ